MLEDNLSFDDYISVAERNERSSDFRPECIKTFYMSYDEYIKIEGLVNPYFYDPDKRDYDSGIGSDSESCASEEFDEVSEELDIEKLEGRAATAADAPLSDFFGDLLSALKREIIVMHYR